MTKAYIIGALHDATKHGTTIRIAQKSRAYVEHIAEAIKRLGGKAWTYREGKNRNVYIVEFSKSFLKDCFLDTPADKIDYIRGYFDTDGGIAKSTTVRYYIYFCQKNFQDLLHVKQMIEEQHITCGKIHNPSIKADPDYWRFYISAKSYKEFATIIGSEHPEKRHYLRMKI